MKKMGMGLWAMIPNLTMDGRGFRVLCGDLGIKLGFDNGFLISHPGESYARSHESYMKYLNEATHIL